MSLGKCLMIFLMICWFLRSASRPALDLLGTHSPVYANGRQIENGRSAAHDIKSNPRVTQCVSQKPVRTVELKYIYIYAEQKDSIT